MNEIPESSNSNGVAEIEGLDTLDYLRGVKSSTCLLLTPSPTPIDFKHPLSEEINEEPFLSLDDDVNDSKMVTLQNPDACAGDSSSSADSNSVVQDPVSAQLINNISMLDYQTLSKNGDIILGQPEGYKLNGSLNVNNRKLPSFVNWNWCVIRKVLLWFVLSGLTACIAAIVTMVVKLPKTCNPDLPWYQGKVFYEIFPASFKDSNNDGIGDIKGLIKKLDYIKDLGAVSIHLNYIFEAHEYPEHYYNTTSLLHIDRSIGVLADFQDLITAVHDRNMRIILDIPVSTMAVPISPLQPNHTVLLTNDTTVKYIDATSVAISHWASVQKVDGFYLKNLERHVEDSNFGKSLQVWKQIIGNDKILMASEEALDKVMKSKGNAHEIFLNRIDLIDINLNLNHGIIGLKNKIEKVVAGVLWKKPHYPWIHWNIGNVHSERISNKQINNTLALTALECILPGTVSIFYGDEIGLGGLSQQDIEGDYHEHEHVHNLVPMTFSSHGKTNSGESNIGILPWNSKSVLEPRYQYLTVLKDFIQLRLNTPTIYLRAIYKEGNVLKNMKVRKTEENLVVIERWYPRRNSCVFVGNLGSVPIVTDLSTMFYRGTVVAATNTSLVGKVLYLDSVTFLPHSALILKLEK
ncbi:amino acid transporter heavy chain SLC3A1-like [Epargyreus clarus]|uniref:amino acid transporter heavy chain SLC3A1-like n=1 Tax=Epargyreus clarus TaxID=520877 RepID=UPI003C2DF8F3